MFKAVAKELDVPTLEREVTELWMEHDVEGQYIRRNDGSETRYSFIDGPITANGPMGVHHAWGRTYKDLWQRYNTMLGKKQRYQNGFDCQGLWVEVTVERELGFKSKRDIEEFGIAEFVRACKANVFKFAALQTSQSRRLGYFMDWDNSYFTLSDQNNYEIWNFLKTCHERGLLYRGPDVMPWCIRCGTGISDAEAAEGYEDLTHRSVYARFPVAGRPGEYLLVWTTTPWTLTSNVAVAVNPALRYLKVRQGEYVYYVAKNAAGAVQGERDVLDEFDGSVLVGMRYSGPFDELAAATGAEHVVIPWADVSEEEGTGLVHIAPGCGKEDFALGKEFGLKTIAPIDSEGKYGEGFGWLTGRNVLDVADDIIENLSDKDVLYRAHDYTHRYPTCWRCHTPLVFRLVEEWFISMDPLRQPMMDVVRKIRWIPHYGLDRELDWLKNMGDWMISKKRYWGLALPFWICPNDHLQVLGGKDELFQKALSGVDELESPHRPWIDEVTLRCPECGGTARRVQDVGNPWLDAGIVPFSTLRYSSDPEYWRQWFPAHFITESFPGQFRNWFYSLLAMSTVLEDTNPFENVLAYQLVMDKDGREMHKSWGNLIPFDAAADRAGADLMRWLFCGHSPESSMRFGWAAMDEVKRRLLVLWNTYSFFVTYATLDGWSPAEGAPPPKERPILDRWILARLNGLITEVRRDLDVFEAAAPTRSIERFIEELSTWYVRRSRRRFWRAENDVDKLSAYATLYHCLTTLTGLIAPFMPFLAENLYQNLVRSVDPGAMVSVHLTDYPVADEEQVDVSLVEGMDAAQRLVALGRAARDKANVKVRQPLATMYVRVPTAISQADIVSMKDIILDELNVRELSFAGDSDEFMRYSVRPNLPALGPRFGKGLPQLRAALDLLDPDDVAAAVQAERSVEVTVNNQRVELLPSDILVTAQQREGYAAMAEGGFLVALDTHLTQDLIEEGWVREVVRRVNDWRKSADFVVQDRIHVRYIASPALAAALERQSSFVCAETLAASFVAASAIGHGYAAEASFGGESLAVELERAVHS